MNKFNQTLAFLAAAAAMLCAVSCGGENEPAPAVTTAVPSSTEPAAASETATTGTSETTDTESSSVTASSAKEVQTIYRSYQNEPLNLKATFLLPELEYLDLYDEEKHTDQIASSASYYYGRTQTITVHSEFYPVSAVEAVKLTSRQEGFEKTDLASSYETYLYKADDNDGTFSYHMEFIAGTYLDGFRHIRFVIDPKKDTNDEDAQLICRTIAQSLKLEGSDATVYTENGFSLCFGGVEADNKIAVTGKNAELKPTVQTGSVDAKTSFQANGVQWIARTNGFTGKAAYDALNASDYSTVTLSGKPAKLHTELTADGVLTLTGQILFNENNALSISLRTDNAEKQTQFADADAFSAKLREMMNDENKAQTEEQLTGYLKAFCDGIRFGDTSPAVTEPAVTFVERTTATTITTTVFVPPVTTTVTTTKARPVTTAPPQRTEPVYTTEVPSKDSLPMDVSNPFRNRSEIALSGRGYVYAKSGLRLREKPSASGSQIGTVKFGTTVDITALAVTGNCYGWNNNRWYRVKTDGKTGYVSADYLAATFTQEPDELSDLQIGAMVNFLYCQHHSLFVTFSQNGGFHGSVDSSDTLGDYERILPESLTMDQIYDEFYQYFARYYHRNELTQDASSGNTVFYRQKNGKLYAACPDMSESWIDNMNAEDIVEISDSEITVHARHYLKKHRSSDPDAYTIYEFSLYYEDGCWKAGKSDSLFSSFTRM